MHSWYVNLDTIQVDKGTAHSIETVHRLIGW